MVVLPMKFRGRSDDVSDEIILSPKISKDAVIEGIGRISNIDPIAIPVALRGAAEPAMFTSSRVWRFPRLVLKFSAGNMVLLNISFLVAYANSASEALRIGLLVLRHLGIDSGTLLETNWSSSHGTDFSAIENATNPVRLGSLGRLMMARLGRFVANRSSEAAGAPDPDSPRGNYFLKKFDNYPFPYPSFLPLQSDLDE